MFKANEAGGCRPKTQAVKPPVLQKKAKRNGYQLPDKLPFGEILTDVKKKQWRLGKSIGVGGFGEIYSASDDISKAVPESAKFVIKIEPHENGPLFTETHFYTKAGKPEMINEWKAQKKLKFIGMPRSFGFGSHQISGVKYRFLVMDRFGMDVQRIFEANKKQFSIKTAYSLAIKLLDVVEYIHSTGYVHADIKGSNLLLGYGDENEVYLVDFGLACKYVLDDQHKPYEEDRRKAHDGTIEFTSRDAHVGAHSRRGDMEILAYNVLQWLCSRLPWEDHLKDKERVHTEKKNFMKNLPKSIHMCFKDGQLPDGLLAYFKYVDQLKFEEKPDYNYCRKLFINGLKKSGFKYDEDLELRYKMSPTRKKASKLSNDNENNAISSPQVKRTRNNISQSTNHKEAPRKNEKTRSQDGLVKSKIISKSTNSLMPNNITSTIDVPTPAMLLVMQMREKQKKTNNQKSSIKRPRTNTVLSAARSTPLQSDSEDSSVHEDFFTPPTTRCLRSGRKRTSSSSNDFNSSATPELF